MKHPFVSQAKGAISSTEREDVVCKSAENKHARTKRQIFQVYRVPCKQSYELRSSSMSCHMAFKLTMPPIAEEVCLGEDS